MRKAEDHGQKNLDKDLELAAFICREIREGRPEAMACLYEKYHPVLERYTARRVTDSEMAKEILQEFWAGLLNGNDICGYKAQNQIQLRTYLIRRLYFRIIDAFRKQSRYQKLVSPLESPSQNEDGSEKPEYEPKDCVETFDETLCNRIDAELLYTALDILSEIRPDDAGLIQDVMAGKTYQEIAVRYGAVSEEQIQKKSASLRKQYSRPVTGSLARLKCILERLIQQKGLDVVDFFG